MLKSVLALFQHTPDDEASNQHTIEVATAALLCEIMRADRVISDDELATLKGILNQQFSLSTEELTLLVEQGQEKADNAVDLVQFTHVINKKCSVAQKDEMIRSLWRIAYADRRLDPIEEHMIRRIADLLYIPHRQFIRSKLEILQQ
jgi:uncharacterized tellurite resistance protein B-like protein